jgi:predicted methyltransferase
MSHPPLLTGTTAKNILEGETHVSLDLGLSETEIIHTNTKVILNDLENILIDELEKISNDQRSIYFVKENRVFKAAISERHYYSLVHTKGAPTIEIDGIRMHRTKNTTPERDAEKKLAILGLKKGKVLDTCMGLGYTAILAYENGAKLIISIEYEPNVIRLAKLNPWSRKLFCVENMHKLIGESFFTIESLPKNYFDYIIHDPPRHNFAGHLFGKSFYKKLAEVIKPNGKLFHYTGEPRSRYRSVNIQRGVMKRLGEVGFMDLEYHPSVMGITCTLSTA